jgi:hypothetical protein
MRDLPFDGHRDLVLGAPAFERAAAEIRRGGLEAGVNGRVNRDGNHYSFSLTWGRTMQVRECKI